MFPSTALASASRQAQDYRQSQPACREPPSQTNTTLHVEAPALGEASRYFRTLSLGCGVTVDSARRSAIMDLTIWASDISRLFCHRCRGIECVRGRAGPLPRALSASRCRGPRPGGALAPRLQNLGSHTFKVTTKSVRAQQFINQGLNLAYGFNHPEAGRAFAEAARLIPRARWRTGARPSCSGRTSTPRWRRTTSRRPSSWCRKRAPRRRE